MYEITDVVETGTKNRRRFILKGTSDKSEDDNSDEFDAKFKYDKGAKEWQFHKSSFEHYYESEIKAIHDILKKLNKESRGK